MNAFNITVKTTSPNARMNDGHIACHFLAKGYDIRASFLTNTVSRIVYRKSFAFDTPSVEDFLNAYGPDVNWKGPYKDSSDGSYRWYGINGDALAYVASLDSNGLVLLLWTKVDDDFVAARCTQEASGM